MCGVRPYVRATFNPDPNSWVKAFFAPWVDKRHPDPARSGEPRYFVRDGGLIKWVPQGTPDAKSVTFVRSTVYDNQILLAKNPEYVASLKAMSLIDRMRLLDGDWDAVESGNMFRREWFEIVRVAPSEGRRVRYWDLASTELKPGKDPDSTAGVKMCRAASNVCFIEDVKRLQGTPKTVEDLIEQTAQLDGKSVEIVIEQEPGSSGVTVIDHYVRKVLFGWSVRGLKSTGNKAERAKPLSAQCEAGNVKLVDGLWNEDFLNELVPFPNPNVHDDQVDGASGAFGQLAHDKAALEFY